VLLEIFPVCLKSLLDVVSKMGKLIKALKILLILIPCLIFVLRENRSGEVDVNQRRSARKAGGCELDKFFKNATHVSLCSGL